MKPFPPWLLHALQLFAAAAIALTVAVRLGLHHPFWAAMPVWVVAQPNREDLLLRAALRVAGTVLGAVIGLFALTMVPDAALRLVVLVLAVAAGTAGAYWIGTVYSYGVLLAGITVALVLVPALDQPLDAASLAIDRIGCTLIGVVAVTAITFLFTPRRLEPRPPRTAPARRAVVVHGVIAGAAALSGGLLVQRIGGPTAVAVAMSLCIFALVIGSSRNPVPIMTYLPRGAAIGAAGALLYRGLDLMLPDPVGTALLLIMPFLAVGAVLRSHPRSAPFGLDGNMCFLLVAEAGTAGHQFGAYVQGGIALVATAFAFAAIFRWIGVLPQSP